MNSSPKKSQLSEMMQDMHQEEEMDEGEEYSDSESDENEDGFDFQNFVNSFIIMQREYIITSRTLGRIQLINGKFTLKSL